MAIYPICSAQMQVTILVRNRWGEGKNGVLFSEKKLLPYRASFLKMLKKKKLGQCDWKLAFSFLFFFFFQITPSYFRRNSWKNQHFCGHLLLNQNKRLTDFVVQCAFIGIMLLDY